MANSRKPSLGIQRVASSHVFVRDLERSRDHYIKNLFKDPQAGPLFIELIQRKGDRGFGGGNFRALFESIERRMQTAPVALEAPAASE